MTEDQMTFDQTPPAEATPLTPPADAPPVVAETPAPLPVHDVEVEDSQIDTNPPVTEQDRGQTLESMEQELDTIVPNKESVERVIGKGPDEMKFVQKPLGFFAKAEFFALLARAIDDAMTADSGMSFATILSQVGVERDGLNLQGMNDNVTADAFIRAVAKIVRDIPEFMKDCYCIILNVPRNQREYVKIVMEQSPEDGGISDEMGTDIITRFFDQNLGEMQDFFQKEMPTMFKRASRLFAQNRAKRH